MPDTVDVYAANVDRVPRRILVTGSRSLDIRRYDHPNAYLQATCAGAKEGFIRALEDAVAELAVTDEGLHPVVIVHGGAKFGADNWAQHWVFHAWDSARFHRSVLHVERHRADWDRYGKAAGMLRNGEMIALMDRSTPHRVIACWDGTSPGTKNTLDRALLAGLTVKRSWR